MGSGLNSSLGSFQPEEIGIILGEVNLQGGMEGKLEKRILERC